MKKNINIIITLMLGISLIVLLGSCQSEGSDTKHEHKTTETKLRHDKLFYDSMYIQAYEVD